MITIEIVKKIIKAQYNTFIVELSIITDLNLTFLNIEFTFFLDY